MIEVNLREEIEGTMESLIGEMEQGCQKVMEGANTMSAMALSSSPMLENPPPKENPLISNWFELLVSKKRSIVPVTLPMGDMVRKCLGKTPKNKREKIETILNINKNIGQWVAK